MVSKLASLAGAALLALLTVSSGEAGVSHLPFNGAFDLPFDEVAARSPAASDSDRGFGARPERNGAAGTRSIAATVAGLTFAAGRLDCRPRGHLGQVCVADAPGAPGAFVGPCTQYGLECVSPVTSLH